MHETMERIADYARSERAQVRLNDWDGVDLYFKENPEPFIRATFEDDATKLYGFIGHVTYWEASFSSAPTGVVIEAMRAGLRWVQQ